MLFFFPLQICMYFPPSFFAATKSFPEAKSTFFFICRDKASSFSFYLFIGEFDALIPCVRVCIALSFVCFITDKILLCSTHLTNNSHAGAICIACLMASNGLLFVLWYFATKRWPSRYSYFHRPYHEIRCYTADYETITVLCG